MSKVRVHTEFAPTNLLSQRIRSGDVADVAILTASSIDEFTRDGTVDAASRIDLALSRVGLAVRSGALRPDIGTADALRAALLRATSLVYSRTGASGIFFAELIRRLGIEAEVNAKAIIIPEGLTARAVAAGEVELAVQQISELMMVPGIDIVGPLPPKVESRTIFTGAVFARSHAAEQALAFVKFLSSPAARALLCETGLEPPA